MSWNASDYDHEIADRARDTERAWELEQEASDARARELEAELAFRETPACEEACFGPDGHTIACTRAAIVRVDAEIAELAGQLRARRAIAEPVQEALAGWLNATTRRAA